MDQEVNRIVELTKNIIKSEKMCKTCVYSNEPCTWCARFDKETNRAKYGCKDHMTDNQYMDKIAQEQAEYRRKEAAIDFLDIELASYLLQGADIIMTKIGEEQQRRYDAFKERCKDDEIRFGKQKQNREKLKKGMVAMKCAIQDFHNAYQNSVQYYLDYMFNDKGGYDYKESDKSLVNAGFITAISAGILNATLDNDDNVNALMNYVFSLKGKDIFTKEHCLRYLVNR